MDEHAERGTQPMVNPGAATAGTEGVRKKTRLPFARQSQDDARLNLRTSSPLFLDGLSAVAQDIQNHLLNLTAVTRHGRHVFLVLPDDFNLTEVKMLFQVIVVPCQFHTLVKQFHQVVV